ncbi:hypothetical protein BURKHO8Y_140510 [Burkholderia sp. 8Y]|nr:hypothetical protein BURKHO8Y_140510 [Burkholderia sp. 8Y]
MCGMTARRVRMRGRRRKVAVRTSRASGARVLDGPHARSYTCRTFGARAAFLAAQSNGKQEALSRMSDTRQPVLPPQR